MTHVAHELAQEFPLQFAKIQVLKERDAHFARLVEEYHTTNRAVHRYETRVEPVSEEHEQAARRQRLRLRDEISSALTAAR